MRIGLRRSGRRVQRHLRDAAVRPDGLEAAAARCVGIGARRQLDGRARRRRRRRERLGHGTPCRSNTTGNVKLTGFDSSLQAERELEAEVVVAVEDDALLPDLVEGQRARLDRRDRGSGR